MGGPGSGAKKRKESERILRERRELYDAVKSDRAIAAIQGVSAETIRLWRKKEGLPRNFNTISPFEIYDKDRPAVREYRQRLRLMFGPQYDGYRASDL